MTQTRTLAELSEWQLLLRCARRPSFEDSESARSFAPCDTGLLLDLAEEHGVTNLLALFLRQCSAGAPAALVRGVQERQRANAITALSLIAEMLRVTELLNAAGIESLVLKGPALSLQAYGDPAVRQYGDIDLLLRDRDIYRATEFLRESGCVPRIPLEVIASGKIPGEYVFSRNGLLAELHTERTLRYFPNPLAVEKLFARKARLELNGKGFATQSVEDALLSACTHGAKHFWQRLQWVADVAALLDRHRDSIDWDLTLRSARELGSERILRLGLLLAGQILGSPLPPTIEVASRRDSTAAKMARALAQALPDSSETSLGLLGRAAFRIRMRGSFFAGLSYLARLSLSPTEHDWQSNASAKTSRLRESSRRLLRLAGKYGRNTPEQ